MEAEKERKKKEDAMNRLQEQLAAQKVENLKRIEEVKRQKEEEERRLKLEKELRLQERRAKFVKKGKDGDQVALSRQEQMLELHDWMDEIIAKPTLQSVDTEVVESPPRVKEVRVSAKKAMGSSAI